MAAAFCAALGWGEPASAQDFGYVLNQTIANSPNIGVARAGVRAAEAQIAAARAGFRPDIGGRVEGALGVQGNPSGWNNQNHLTGELNITQPVYQGGTVRNEIRSAEFEVLAAEEAVHAAEQEALLNAIEAFADFWRDGVLLAYSEQAGELALAEIADLRARFEAGAGTLATVAQAEVREATTRARYSLAAATLGVSRARFQLATGIDPTSVSLPTLNRGLLPGSLSSAIAIAETEHPTLREAEYRRQIANVGVDIARGGIRPTVELFGNLEATVEAGAGRTNNATAGIRLTIPLYGGGAGVAAIREAQARVIEADYLAAAQHAAIESSVRSSYVQYQGAVAQVEAAQALLDAARLNVQALEDAATAGAATAIDVRSANQDLLSAQDTWAGAIHDQFVAYYSYLSSVGLLTLEYLQIGQD